MFKYRIRLDTMTDVNEFVHKISLIDGKITVSDNCGMKVNAKSIMGMLYALEFEELWCESDCDIYTVIKDFVVENLNFSNN